MTKILAKIEFLHDARPYIPATEYTDLYVSYPEGVLPNKGDIIQINDITHPKGAFVINHRVFDAKCGALHQVTLVLNTEGA